MGKESPLKLSEREQDAREEVPMRTPKRLYAHERASFISRITALCNCVPPLLWLMCRNNPTRGGTDRHEIHATARYRHCSPRPHCRASVSGPGCVRGDHADSQVLSSLAVVRLQTAVAVDAAVRTV